MKILIIGGGGREHALGDKLKEANERNELFFAPGNAGTAKIGENVSLIVSERNEIVRFCKREQIDLVVIGPEQPLVDGLADALRESSVSVFGPNANAAILEGEKSFAKDFMKRHNIPTADYKIFKKDNKQDALNYLSKSNYPIVIKADGLAAGKGVVICDNEDAARTTITDYFDNAKFGAAGEKVVIEEFLEGEELSLFVITDGKNYIMLPPSQDYKKIYDDNKGPNTGGMGAYAPVDFVTEETLEEIEDNIVIPTIEGMRKEGREFSGCLYCGLISTNDGVKVIEYNARFGDPETQSVLSLLDGRFDMLLLSVAQGLIDRDAVQILDKKAVNVVAASEGYPGSYEKGKEIFGLENVSPPAKVFHAGTIEKNGKIYTNGGRVLAVNAVGESLQEAREMAYENLSKISFEGMYFRKDIASEKA